MTEAVGATLDEARKRGLRFYRRATPCTRGHDSPWYVSCRRCVQCVRSRMAGIVMEPPPRKPKRRRAPVVVVEPVKPPKPVEAEPREPGGQRYLFKHGSYADTVKIHAGTAKLIDACIERVFGDHSKRIGHERRSEAA